MAKKSGTLISLLLAAFAINLDTTIVNVALPSLVRELHASTSQLQWIVDAYSLVFASLLLAAGSFSDRVGRKGVLLAGLGVFGVASVAGGLTTSPSQLIVARCAMGLGAAMIFPATLSIIANVFVERAERARAIGLWGASSGVAIALGPIVGGWLLEHFSWTSVFFAMAPVAAVGAALVARTVPTSRDPDAPKADRPGLVLSTAAMALLIYTIIEAPGHGWSSGRSVAGFAPAVALFAGFIAWERRAPEPLIDLGLFRNLRFTAASGSVTVVFFSLAGFIFLITQYFQFFKGYSPLSTGVHLLPVATSVGVMSVLGTKLAVRTSTKLVVAGGLVSLAGFFGWVSTASSGTSYLEIAGQMVLGGSGMGLVSAPATEAIIGVVPRAKAGVGSAVNDATRLLGNHPRRRGDRKRLRLSLRQPAHHRPSCRVAAPPREQRPRLGWSRARDRPSREPRPGRARARRRVGRLFRRPECRMPGRRRRQRCRGNPRRRPAARPVIAVRRRARPDAKPAGRGHGGRGLTVHVLGVNR
jgi:EmrB/QacA subfamily drug resistance transporter